MVNNKKISKNDIGKLLGKWSKEYTLFVPSRENDVPKMTEWDGKDTSFIDWYRNTVVPAKSSFLPPVEEMFAFQKSKDGYNIELPPSDGQKQLIFGIRPCDAKALAILDMNFEDSYQDPYYLDRRKNTVLVGFTCTNPYDSCFCTSLGSGPGETSDVDLMLTDIGDDFFIEVVSDKGKDLINIAGDVKEATEADEAKARQVKETSYNKVIRKLDTETIKERLMPAFENQDYWQKIAAKCISCGICTFLCPTCYCFEINDELVKGEGVRVRNWDSCAFPTYTKMPMENPRLEKWRRVRQKVYHKYQFYPMNFGVIACTGCGRCIRQCPVNWDITQVLNSLPAEV